MTMLKDVTVVINGSHAEGVVAPELVSFTMDFWPEQHDPSFANSSITANADLGSPELLAAARGLSPAFLRIGGSMADSVLYQVPNNTSASTNNNATTLESSSLSSSSSSSSPSCNDPHTCLTMDRWDEILRFAQDAGVRIVFCLDYLYHIHDETTDWDGSNAFEFLNYTKHHAPSPGVVYGFELGNEPFHTAEKNNNVTRYQLAYKTLRSMILEIWRDDDSSSTRRRPKVIGPAASAGGQFDKSIAAVGKELDIATYHSYSGDGRSDSIRKKAMMRDFFAPHPKLDQVSSSAFQYVKEGTELWLGEGAMAMHSGRNKVTNTIMGSFWYAHQLGLLAKTKPLVNKVFCRQTLMGGYYELISHDGHFAPNPDYWVARLWKELMGTTALEAYGKDCCVPGNDDLLVHAFCARPSNIAAPGDVTLLLINIAADQSFNVQVGAIAGTTTTTSSSTSGARRSEFVLESAKGAHTLDTKRIHVNGETPKLGKGGEILPPLGTKIKEPTDPLVSSPHSIMFVVLHNVSAPSCIMKEVVMVDEDHHVTKNTAGLHLLLVLVVLSAAIVTAAAIVVFLVYNKKRMPKKEYAALSSSDMELVVVRTTTEQSSIILT